MRGSADSLGRGNGSLSSRWVPSGALAVVLSHYGRYGVQQVLHTHEEQGRLGESESREKNINSD
jgi:hypothetical protein